ncbi:hypothetical protein [Leekyejoonella antrihumi]|uniref:Uncharacterized protein n=1 Tax=Leekyejoonella antrihumi TaxID=1660198 RepID=A0A563E5Y5_9MICO|nr:hypothetical protein [Leekyejoonella antrihumi]TWP37632.1 hypothetical protein FGL98_05315 [Leekyejoonella antrihumi]
MPRQTGGEAFHECTVDSTGSSTITVGGNVTALDSATVLLNGMTVGGRAPGQCAALAQPRT